MVCSLAAALRRSLAHGALFAVVLAAAPFARSATFTWNNAPTNNQWGTSANWLPAGVPGGNDAVQFTNISLTTGIDLGGAQSADTLLFGGLSGYALNSGSLTLNGSQINTNAALLATNYSINVPLTLTSTTTFTTGALTTLTLSQPFTVAPNQFIRKSGAGTLTITAGPSSAFHIRTEGGMLDVNGGTLVSTGTSSNADFFLGTAARVRGGGRITSAGDVWIDSVGQTVSVEGAGSELHADALIQIGINNGGLIDVFDHGKLTTAKLQIGGNFRTNPDLDRVIIRGQGQAVVGVANVGVQEEATGELNIADAGTSFQSNSMNIGGTGGVPDQRARGRVVVEKGASAAVGDTTLLTTGSKIIVDKATLTVARLQSFAGTTPRIELTNPAGGQALTIAGATTAIPTFGGVIADSAAGPGGLRKVGPGTQILTGHHTYTGGTVVEAGVLQLGVGDALTRTGRVEIAGGALNLGGHSQHIGDLKLTDGALTGAAGSTLVAGNVDVFVGTIATPLITAAAITKHGSGTTTATAPITADALVVMGGVFDAQAGAKGNVNTAASAQLTVRGTLEGNLLGATGSTTTLTGATIVTGSVADEGLVEVGAHTLALSGASDPAIAAVTLSGGVLTSTGVVTLSSTLSGSGVVVARVGSVPAIPPATIRTLGGPLMVGTLAAADSLGNYLGSLTAGVQQLTLLSSGFTTLGNAATVNGGSINSINGVQVNPGKSLTGFGVVNGPLKNLGVVTGGSGASVLRFTGPVTGDGSFLANVRFEHTYSPGASPAAVSFIGDPVFASTSRLEIEIGGLMPGDEHDHVDVEGELTLGGVLRVSLIDGFAPVVGDAFDLLDWTTLDGAFAALELPALVGLRWDASQLYSSGVLAVAPLYEADFDSNGRVDAADLALWQAGFNKAGAGRADGDATGDQLVTGADFVVWQRQLGLGVASLPATTTVPEPASAFVIVSALAALAMCRRVR
jgi:fibronectin-binding autotransporter adhesin